MSKVKSKELVHQSADEFNTELSVFFITELRDIYWAENHLIMALPKMQASASSPPLQKAFANHLKQTKDHAARLQEIFDILNEKTLAKKCDAMEGLVEEGEGVINSTRSGTKIRDLGLILAARKVEHYEIVAYNGLIRLAQVLERQDVISLLQQTLGEEEETDDLLANMIDEQIVAD